MDHYRASLITVITIRCCCMRSVVRSLVRLLVCRPVERLLRHENSERSVELPRDTTLNHEQHTNIHNGKRIEYKSDIITIETMNFPCS